jgi:hypothetical protein
VLRSTRQRRARRSIRIVIVLVVFAVWFVVAVPLAVIVGRVLYKLGATDRITLRLGHPRGGKGKAGDGEPGTSTGAATG